MTPAGLIRRPDLPPVSGIHPELAYR